MSEAVKTEDEVTTEIIEEIIPTSPEPTNLDEYLESIPELYDWEPTKEDIYYEFFDDSVKASYNATLNLKEGNRLSDFIIWKAHYKDRMEDVCKHINYFLTFFDTEKELFTSTLSVKYVIDTNPNMSKDAFRKLVLSRIITPMFISKVKLMSKRLYLININTDESGKYKNTPKITNDIAKQILAVSFAIRCILPLCVHYSDTNANFVNKKDYIGCFDKIFYKIVKKFEEGDIAIWNPLCRFVKWRVDRAYAADIGICMKKKQLYGTVKSTYLEEVIHEVILVKSLHKLDYKRSVVSFIDGVIFSYHMNFKIENFKYKPVEIESAESSGDDDDHLSHAEAIEMAIYRVDESDALINEANATKVIKDIEERFKIELDPKEFQFYFDHVRVSIVTQSFLNDFYAKYFHDPFAIYNLNRMATIKLLLYMKKYLQMKGLSVLPHLVTAKVRGKIKDNVIKNRKFNEMYQTDSANQNILRQKYKYLYELNPKEDPIAKKLSLFINSTFEFVDYDEAINEILYEDIDINRIIHEFNLFMTII